MIETAPENAVFFVAIFGPVLVFLAFCAWDIAEHIADYLNPSEVESDPWNDEAELCQMEVETSSPWRTP